MLQLPIATDAGGARLTETYLLHRQLLLHSSHAVVQGGEAVDLVLVLARHFGVGGRGFVLFGELGGGLARWGEDARDTVEVHQEGEHGGTAREGRGRLIDRRLKTDEQGAKV